MFPFKISFFAWAIIYNVKYDILYCLSFYSSWAKKGYNCIPWHFARSRGRSRIKLNLFNNVQYYFRLQISDIGYNIQCRLYDNSYSVVLISTSVQGVGTKNSRKILRGFTNKVSAPSLIWRIKVRSYFPDQCTNVTKTVVSCCVCVYPFTR